MSSLEAEMNILDKIFEGFYLGFGILIAIGFIYQVCLLIEWMWG